MESLGRVDIGSVHVNDGPQACRGKNSNQAAGMKATYWHFSRGYAEKASTGLESEDIENISTSVGCWSQVLFPDPMI
jgi:hypothetical protein